MFNSAIRMGVKPGIDSESAALTAAMLIAEQKGLTNFRIVTEVKDDTRNCGVTTVSNDERVIATVEWQV